MPEHRDTIETLARELGWKRGIEVGVGTGLLHRRLIAAGVEMLGVDLGLRQERRAAVEAIPGASVMWMPSVEAARQVADHCADFVFIDAGHSYEAVKADIEAWWPKVRPGGWFGGHDYHPAHPGVIQAVDEALGDLIELLPGHIWARRTC